MPFFSPLFALVVCAVCSMLVGAQDGDFVETMLSVWDGQGFTEFSSMVRAVQADPTQTAFFDSISNTSTPMTLFIPTNDACK